MSSTISAPLFTTSAAPLSALVLAHSDQTTLVEGILGSHGFVVACALAKTVTATYGPIAAERRAGFRLQVNIAASECTMLHRGELRSLAGVRLVNLSHTGLCLEAAEMLPQGAIVEVSFTVPQSQVRVELVGAVMWTHASGRGGIKFNQPDPEELAKFEDWLDSVLPNAV